MAADSSTPAAAPSPATPFTARTPAPQAPPPPSFAQLPPHLFDIIPSTERLLSRLLLPESGILQSQAAAAAAAAGAAAEDGTTGTAVSANNENLPEHKQHLDIQKLEQSANQIRVQIQKARHGVTELPDVDRTIQEQKDEIAWLERRIARMQAMMDKVRRDFAKDREDSVAANASGADDG